jgi:hypothetical protein
MSIGDTKDFRTEKMSVIYSRSSVTDEYPIIEGRISCKISFLRR